MTLIEIPVDLFKCKIEGKNFLYVQCGSADLALGKGIAAQFNKHFDVRNKAREKDKGVWVGSCITTYPGPVTTLITKEKYWQKPKYDTLRLALIALKKETIEKRIEMLIMPHIGCGLDRLDWDKVKDILWDTFKDMNICIIACGGPSLSA